MLRSKIKMRNLSNKAVGGQVLVEFCLAFPLIVFLCLGLLQLSLIGQAVLFCRYAAHCAARSYCVWIQQGQDSARARALHAAQVVAGNCIPPLERLRVGIDFQASDDQDRKGSFENQIFRIEVTARYPLAIPLITKLFGGSQPDGTVALHASVLMQAEDGTDFLDQHPQEQG
jgi:hypothetical protein